MSDWIEWHGGECPVPPDTRVLFRVRNGVGEKGKAGSLAWDHLGAKHQDGWSDIIAYRTVKDTTIAHTTT